MARPLAVLERFFERLLERPAARLFRAPLQPVQLQRRLDRAMESERHIAAQRTYVPDRYRVQLNPTDLATFAGYQATLETDLSRSVLDRARRRGYTLSEAPRVTLHGNTGVAAGDIVVLSERRDPLAARPAPVGFRRLEATTDAAAVGPFGGPVAASSGAEPVGSSVTNAGAPEATAMFAAAGSPFGPVILFVEVPGQAAVRRRLDGGVLSIGRGPENDLVLADHRVSRQHGRLSVRQGTLVYDDLGSTNGSYVNDRRIQQVVLGPADVLRLGGSRLTILPEDRAPWTP